MATKFRMKSSKTFFEVNMLCYLFFIAASTQSFRITYGFGSIQIQGETQLNLPETTFDKNSYPNIEQLLHACLIITNNEDFLTKSGDPLSLINILDINSIFTVVPKSQNAVLEYVLFDVDTTNPEILFNGGGLQTIQYNPSDSTSSTIYLVSTCNFNYRLLESQQKWKLSYLFNFAGDFELDNVTDLIEARFVRATPIISDAQIPVITKISNSTEFDFFNKSAKLLKSWTESSHTDTAPLDFYISVTGDYSVMLDEEIYSFKFRKAREGMMTVLVSYDSEGFEFANESMLTQVIEYPDQYEIRSFSENAEFKFQFFECPIPDYFDIITNIEENCAMNPNGVPGKYVFTVTSPSPFELHSFFSNYLLEKQDHFSFNYYTMQMEGAGKTEITQPDIYITNYKCVVFELIVNSNDIKGYFGVYNVNFTQDELMYGCVSGILYSDRPRSVDIYEGTDFNQRTIFDSGLYQFDISHEYTRIYFAAKSNQASHLILLNPDLFESEDGVTLNDVIYNRKILNIKSRKEEKQNLSIAAILTNETKNYYYFVNYFDQPFYTQESNTTLIFVSSLPSSVDVKYSLENKTISQMNNFTVEKFEMNEMISGFFGFNGITREYSENIPENHITNYRSSNNKEFDKEMQFCLINEGKMQKFEVKKSLQLIFTDESQKSVILMNVNGFSNEAINSAQYSFTLKTKSNPENVTVAVLPYCNEIHVNDIDETDYTVSQPQYTPFTIGLVSFYEFSGLISANIQNGFTYKVYNESISSNTWKVVAMEQEEIISANIVLINWNESIKSENETKLFLNGVVFSEKNINWEGLFISEYNSSDIFVKSQTDEPVPLLVEWPPGPNVPLIAGCTITGIIVISLIGAYFTTRTIKSHREEKSSSTATQAEIILI